MTQMTQLIRATFDGEVFRPTQPPALPPNSEVTLALVSVTPGAPGPSKQVEAEEQGKKTCEEEGCSFLKLAPKLNLQGPPDWSRNFEEYLYHGKKFPDE